MHGLWCAFIYSFICSLINSVIHWFIHTLDIPLFLDERVPKRTNRCILFEDTYFMYFSTRYPNLWWKMAKLVRIPNRNGPEWAFFCFFLAFRALFYTLFHSKWWQWNENWREIIRHIIPAIKKGFQSKEDNFSQFGTGVKHIYHNVQGCTMFQRTSTRGYDRCAHVPIFDF